jgi:hypothetical protein
MKSIVIFLREFIDRITGNDCNDRFPPELIL